MKTLFICALYLLSTQLIIAQDLVDEADSLKRTGLLVPALQKYVQAFMQSPTPDHSYKIASTTALLWTTQMRDTSFYFLQHSLSNDSTLQALYNPDFLSLIEDPRWERIVDKQISKYESKNGAIRNEDFARELFRMIIKDQGFMYVGNVERQKYIQNGGYFSSPTIFPILAMEEYNQKQNKKRLIELLDKYGWPTSTAVTEYAAAGAALVINHTNYELRSKYFPMLEEAFQKGEAQSLRYAKMKDRLLVEEGKEQLFGTQIKFDDLKRVPHPIQNPQLVDKRRSEIGLGPLKPYLKARFNIDWAIEQKNE